MLVVKLGPERWREYRTLRLDSLHAEPAAFGATYASASAKPDEFWITRLEDSAADPLRVLLFAEVEGRLVGMIGAHPEEGAVHLISMFVRSEQRGRGIGRLLVEALIEQVRTHNPATEIRLQVRPSQAAAVRLYERCGFLRSGVAEVEGCQELTMFHEPGSGPGP